MDNSEQQGLSGAVRAEHNRALTVLKAKTEPLKKHPPVGLITNVRALEREDGCASTRRALRSDAICLLPLC